MLAGAIGFKRIGKGRPAGSDSLDRGTACDGSVECQRARQAWLGFGLVLLLAGLAGPDSLGSGHGEYLPQRLELLGLAALVPAIDFKVDTRWGRVAWACLLVAGVLQTVVVWDYAIYSDRTAGQVIRAHDLVGREQRIATALIGIRSRFRCNPLLHADGWLGVGTGNILWSNYETRYYYFPVQFRPGLDHPNSRQFEEMALRTDPRPEETAIRLWEGILSQHHESIDEVVTWHRDPAIDAITGRWFETAEEPGDIRVFTRRRPQVKHPAAFSTGKPSRNTPRERSTGLEAGQSVGQPSADNRQSARRTGFVRPSSS